jgi:hypothetical protein
MKAKLLRKPWILSLNSFSFSYMAKLKTVQVSGKEYVTVNERLKFFRGQHPQYSLLTKLVLVDETQALIQAQILDETGRVIAEGTSFEKAGSSFINKTSHVENAETSAWGRALGNFGIGIDASVATADEVANAMQNQHKPYAPPVSTASTPQQQADIEDLARSLNLDVVKDIYGPMKITLPNKQQAEVIIQGLKDRLAKSVS